MARNCSDKEDMNFRDYALVSAIYTKPEYDLRVILNCIQSNFAPEEVYDNGELDEWAEKNGYSK